MRVNRGIPQGAYVRAVREDPVRKGLLFAGTELGVFFSADDGENWQPLKLNMPVAPVHDLAIKNNDLVAATHGRAFWVLDDISPLRQLTTEIAAEPAHLFLPEDAVRIRPSTNHDTPLPPEVPSGQNPPAGAILYYRLKSTAQGPVKLEILDSSGQVIRSYSSDDKPAKPGKPPTIADYWFRPEPPLSTAAGTHRFIWDLRYAPPETASRRGGGEYSMSIAFGMNAAHEPQGPLVLPGEYQVRLTVDGKSYTQPLKVNMDPRVIVPKSDMEAEFALASKLYGGLVQAAHALDEIAVFRLRANAADPQKLKMLEEIEPAGERPPGTAEVKPTLSSVRGALAQLETELDAADAAPTEQQSAAAEKSLGQLDQLLRAWESIKK
jgi:hypothetical protein